MSPPKDCTTSSRDLPANGEIHQTQSARALMREAAKVVADLGLSLAPGGVRVLVSEYVASAPGESLRTWVIGHADPTGERAVRNVMTERGW